MRRLLVAVVLAMVASLAVSGVASAARSAADTICEDEELAGGTYENVVVPEGANCGMSATTVTGDVTALENSRLVMNTGNTVEGDLVGDKAEVVQSLFDTVRGDITIEGGETPSEAEVDAALCGTEVLEGNVRIQNMAGAVQIGSGGFCANRVDDGNMLVADNEITKFMFVDDNQVAGALQVKRNHGDGTPKTVTGNTVGKTLLCIGNDQPFTGGPNTANKSVGQCF